MILPWQISCERNTPSCCQIGELVYAETRPHGEMGSKRVYWINGNRIGVADHDDDAMEACEAAILRMMDSFQGITFVKKGNIEIKLGRLEDEEVEAIVCPWGKDTGLAGVSSGLVRAGGTDFLNFMQRIDTIKVCQARISLGGKLPCKFVVHVACPAWRGGKHDELSKLEDCYSACVTGFRDVVIKEASFPCLGMGGNLFPMDKALEVLSTFAQFVVESKILRRLRFVTPSKDVFWSLKSKLMEEDE